MTADYPIPESLAVARAYVHDGSGRRLAPLPEAIGNRVYRTGAPGQAVYTMPATEDTQWLVELLDPREGRLLVIESAYYPLTWVGPITTVRYSPTAGEVAIEASSYEAVLQGRLLPSELVVGGSSGAVFRQLVTVSEAANSANLTVSPNVPEGPVIADVEFGDRTLYDALQLLAGGIDADWWLTHDTSREVLTTVIHFGMRGVDRYNDALLFEGPYGNADARESRVTVEGAAHRLRGIAGARAATEAFSSRLRTERRFSTASPIAQALVGQVSRTIHGHDFSRAPTGGTVLTRADQISIMESVRGGGDLATATESILRRGRNPSRAIDVSHVGELDEWAMYEPGDVIHATFIAPHFIRGYDGVARVLSTRPMEHLGTMQLILEVPGAD